MSKIVLLVADGMADRPLKELNGCTPLDIAETPNMDDAAREGSCGIMWTIGPGIPPGSDVANLSLLGYDALRIYRGRGPFEALGAGLDVKPGDVAFRCNFSTVDERGTVLDRRAGRISTEDARKLAQEIEKIRLDEFPDVEVIFKHTTEHRAVLLLRGPELSSAVSDTDPKAIGVLVKPCKALKPEAEKTASVVNAFCQKAREILESHPVNEERKSKGLLPANAIIVRGAGQLPSAPSIREKFGLDGCCVAANALIRGVCRFAGLDLIDVPGATGTVKTDVMAKAKACVENLRKYDFVFLHVKGTDNASHDGDREAKIDMIERIDAAVGYIMNYADDVCLAITADHATPLKVREHTGDPVPVAMWGDLVPQDDVKRYSERECAKGMLGSLFGKDVMRLLLNFSGRAKKVGA